MLARFFAAIVAALPTPAARGGEIYGFDGRLEARGRVVEFRPSGIRPSAVKGGRVKVGSTYRQLSQAVTEAGVARGRLRVRLSGAATRAARRTTARLLVDTRSFAEFDGFSARGGRLLRSLRHAYDGRSSVEAGYQGGGLPSFQRVWRSIGWGDGTDVWYGIALLVPDTSAWCYWNPVRWDNYARYGSSGDVGGVHIEEGRLRLIRSRYGEDEERLTDGIAVPEDRWFWLEVHQRLSPRNGAALNEIFLDGRLVGSSRSANTFGRRVEDIRFGVVNVATSCSDPSSIYFDRVRIGSSRSGPLGAPSKP
jgi:hypothetical protein